MTSLTITITKANRSKRTVYGSQVSEGGKKVMSVRPFYSTPKEAEDYAVRRVRMGWPDAEITVKEGA
jgi:hypothetical protein